MMQEAPDLETLERDAANGIAGAQYNLGVWHLQHPPQERDVDAARTAFEAATEQGFAPALAALGYMLAIAVYVRLKPEAGPAAPPDALRADPGGGIRSALVLAIFVIVIGGIYTGRFTPTEGAAVGAFLQALTRRGVHVSTTNAYLAQRDFETVSPMLELLGVSVGLLADQAVDVE